tara:strand:+ start:3155 stop:3370 length:216 start_codon:yes stop_codon:yes gene_type:complete
VFKEGQKLRFINAKGIRNPHLKEKLGEPCEAVGDSYTYGKTLVRFNDGKYNPSFNVANERLEHLVTLEQRE